MKTTSAGHTLLPLIFFSAAWLVPVAMTLLQYDVSIVAYAVLFAGTVTAGAMMLNQKHVLIGLPFFALLAPAGGFFELFGTNAVLTDWLMFSLSVPPLLRISTRKSLFNISHSKPSHHYLSALAFIFILSFIFNFTIGNLESFQAAYYIWCYLLIYYYFQRYAPNLEVWNSILLAWTISTSLASLILINAFFVGIDLISFAIDPEKTIDKQSIEYLFRGSYYYAGLHIILGAITSGLLIRVIYLKEKFTIKVLALMAFSIMTTSLVVMMNKTAIFSVAITVVLMSLVFVRRVSYSHLFWMTTILAITSILLFSNLQLFYSDIDMFNDRMASNSSFFIRIQVWISALLELFKTPSALLLGMGPQFIEGGNQNIASLFKSAHDTGDLEGAIDSTWLTVLVELGIFGFIIVVFVFSLALRRMKYMAKHSLKYHINSPVFLIVFTNITFLMFAFITQAIGYAKISWFAFMIILIALSYRPSSRP